VKRKKCSKRKKEPERTRNVQAKLVGKKLQFTRSNVAVGASNGGHGFCFVRVLEQLGKAKVRHMSVESGVQENIVGLDISVHNYWRSVVMQVA